MIKNTTIITLFKVLENMLSIRVAEVAVILVGSLIHGTIWNNLNNYIISSPSLNTFKRRLRVHLIDKP